MQKFTSISAIVAIWVVSAIAIISICKLAGIQIPAIEKIPNWEWIELLAKIAGLMFG